jgi:hypothetical protein
MNFKRLLFRAWFYFRLGYASYVTVPIGLISTMTVVWYLAIKQAPMIQDLFLGRFIVFFIVAGLVVGPCVSIMMGWLHFKRMPAYTAEAEISAESNPYNYKLPPGYQTKVMVPTTLMIIEILERLSLKSGLLSNEDEKVLSQIKHDLHILIAGGTVGR